MPEQIHIIEKVNIEVDVRDMPTALDIRDHVQRFLYDKVFPELETVLNSLSLKEHSFRTGSLSLDLNFTSKENFEATFSARALKELNQMLTGQIRENIPEEKEVQFEKKSAGEKQWEVLLYFLKRGTIPWFASKDQDWLNENELTGFLASTSTWKHAFFELIRDNALAARRLVLQFPGQFVSSFIGAFLGRDLNTIAPDLIKNTRTENHTLQRQDFLFFYRLLEYISKAATPDSIDIKEIEKIAENTRKEEQELPDEIPGAVLTREKKKDRLDNIPDEKEGIYVNQAGLILLHPFLQYFFAAIGLLDGKSFKDEIAQQTAVHVLHYLATGKEQEMEYNQVLEKYLCGLYIHQPVERFIPLSEAIKEECTQVLKAVIGHWSALKNTSPDGLREAFLQRNGKLVSGARDHLVVESKSIDILLEKLPWNYSVIALPWLQKELYVDWFSPIQ